MDGETARGYVDGECPPSEQARWNAHLLVCAACQALVEHERALSSLLKLDQEPAIIQGGAARAAERVLSEGIRDRGRRRWDRLVPVAVLAAGLGAALGIALRLNAAWPVASDRGIGAMNEPQVREVADQLDALEILATDPWLMDDYETVRWLETRINDGQGG